MTMYGLRRDHITFKEACVLLCVGEEFPIVGLGPFFISRITLP